MRSKKTIRKGRKFASLKEALQSAEGAELARSIARRIASAEPPSSILAHVAERVASSDFVPEWTAIKKAYSLSDILEKLPKRMTKRAVDEVLLDAIARRKAHNRGYVDLRFKFGRTTRQMTDFVHRNRSKLDSRIKIIKSQSS